MAKNEVNLVEIFSSVQGEGPYVGYRQIFVRFADCNLKCSYCDTDFSRKEQFQIEQSPGKQDFEFVNNPVDSETLFYYLKKLDDEGKIHHSISLTGGEPLLQSDFLKLFLTENFAKYKFKIYLETNGVLCSELEKIVKLVNIVSMDIKLPSSSGDNFEHWHEHKKFLQILADNKKSKIDYFVKVVIDSNFNEYELHNIVWCLSSQEESVPLILQPESKNPPDPEKLLGWQEKLLKHLNEVRVIPQLHKVIQLP
jgi:organic radical activating enzyme